MGGKPKPRKYDEVLAERVRVAIGPRPDVREQQMFGGLCFMVRGHMSVGVEKKALLVRTGREGYGEALAQPHAREMDFTGKPLRTMVFVDPPGVRTDAMLRRWIERGIAFAESQLAKG